MRTRLILSTIVALIVGLIVGAYIGAGVRPTDQTSSMAGSVGQVASMMVDYGSGDVSVYTATTSPNESLFKFMQGISTANNLTLEYQNYSGLGALITR